LTILDRHILRNLQRYGAIRTVPKSLTRKRYLSVEQRFIEFSGNVGIPVDELDLLFWSMETGEIRK
jgi:N-glycosylase/DNA lyase